LTIRIGLFDSGVGGFTVLKRLLSIRKSYDYIYLADTARLPYGSKKKSDIRKYAFEIVDWFNNKNIDALFIACNTTNSLALDVFQDYAKYPYFDLISEAAKLISTKRIGVLATEATVSSGAYTRELKKIDKSIFIYEKSCPGLVHRIESYSLDSIETKNLVSSYLEPLIKQNLSEIILGCSHYPLLIELLNKLVPPHIEFIDPAVGLAKKVENFDCFNSPRDINNEFLDNLYFFTTGDIDDFSNKVKVWFDINKEIKLTNLRIKTGAF
tara:strand:- start:12218 stop:13021 length:804 start_codon:yes stop_codon:yes gene_type:complete